MLGLQNTADKKTSEGRLIVHDTLGRWEEGTLCVNCAQLAFPATPLFAQFRNLSCPPCFLPRMTGPCTLPWSSMVAVPSWQCCAACLPVFPNLQVSSASNAKVTEFPKSLRIRQKHKIREGLQNEPHIISNIYHDSSHVVHTPPPSPDPINGICLRLPRC